MTTNEMEKYVDILKEELIPALGCTEPISIAYGSSKAVSVLGAFPEKIIVRSSGNIIKNVKSVVVPNTGSLTGIRASAIIGAVGGNHEKGLEVLTDITKEDIEKTKELLDEGFCEIEVLDSDASLHLEIIVINGSDEVSVEIVHTHTNITKIDKNKETIYYNPCDDGDFNNPLTDRSILNVKDILTFAEEIDLEKVQSLLDIQIQYNTQIAEEGLTNDYGINIGKMILEKMGRDNFDAQIKAFTAAGSDARMAGSSMAVVTNSGSGNQGITVSNSVYMFAKLKECDQEKMYRSLILANLIAIHIKTGISRLSSFCGAVVAACGAGCAFTYIEDGTLEKIEMTIKNILSNVSGIICDGAKESCPAKIASSIDAALLAHYLAMDGVCVGHGCGIIENDIENTIRNVGTVGRKGMKETDEVILDIMTNIKN